MISLGIGLPDTRIEERQSNATDSVITALLSSVAAVVSGVLEVQAESSATKNFCSLLP